MVPFSSTRTPSLRRGGVNAWRALCGGYALETVEECVIETQTGYQNRRPDQQIERQPLLAGLKAVHEVSDAERAAALVRDGEITMLDEGEKALWAHALARPDAWVLCGPDKARACASVCALVSATASLRLSACLMTLAFARRPHSGALIARIGWIGRSSNSRSARGGPHDGADIHRYPGAAGRDTTPRPDRPRAAG